jgi:broad specificity phosphatase PhoE
MGVLLLVRHGQASWGSADYDRLSEEGLVQSRLLGAALAARGVRPSMLLSGTMRRHRETLHAVVDGAGWTASGDADAAWDEFDHEQVLAVHGPPESSPESREAFQAWFEDAMRRWAGGAEAASYDEPFGAFCARVEDALARLSGTGGTAVVCTSGGPISWVAARLLGGGTDTWMRLNPVVVNASVTKLVSGRRGTTLVTFNDHAHLEPDHVTYR